MSEDVRSMMKEADAISCLKSFCIRLTRIRVEESMRVMVGQKGLKIPERKIDPAGRKQLANRPKYCHIRDVLERMSEIRNFGKNNQFMISPPKSPSRKSTKGKASVEMDELTTRELGDKRTGLHTHTCLMCYKEFKSTMGLQIHNKQHFGVPKWYLCNHCPASFDRKDRCAAHMKKHMPVRSYFCHICGISFESRYQSLKHDRIHLIVKKYRCRFCGTKFRTEAIYMRHELMHRLKTLHICQICSKPEVSGAALIIHQQIHDKELMDIVLETSVVPLSPASKPAELENDDRHLEEGISLECADAGGCSPTQDIEIVENDYGSSDTNADDCSTLEGGCLTSIDLEHDEDEYHLSDTNADDCSTRDDLEYIENEYCSSDVDIDDCSTAEDSSNDVNVSTTITVQFPKIRNMFKMDTYRSTVIEARTCSKHENLNHDENGYHSNHVEDTVRSARIRRRGEMNNNKPHKCIFC